MTMKMSSSKISTHFGSTASATRWQVVTRVSVTTMMKIWMIKLLLTMMKRTSLGIWKRKKKRGLTSRRISRSHLTSIKTRRASLKLPILQNLTLDRPQSRPLTLARSTTWMMVLQMIKKHQLKLRLPWRKLFKLLSLRTLHRVSTSLLCSGARMSKMRTTSRHSWLTMNELLRISGVKFCSAVEYKNWEDCKGASCLFLGLARFLISAAGSLIFQRLQSPSGNDLPLTCLKRKTGSCRGFKIRPIAPAW